MELLVCRLCIDEDREQKSAFKASGTEIYVLHGGFALRIGACSPAQLDVTSVDVKCGSASRACRGSVVRDPGTTNLPSRIASAIPRANH